MSDHDLLLQIPSEGDPHAAEDDHLDPYVALVGALLRQAVTDAQRPPQVTEDWTETGSRSTSDVQHEARAFLLDQSRLAPGSNSPALMWTRCSRPCSGRLG